MATFGNQYQSLSPYTVLGNNPQMITRYNSNANRSFTQDLVIDKDSVCRLYVNNWGKSSYLKVPPGFIPDPTISRLVGENNDFCVVGERNKYIQFMMTAIQPSFQETVTPMKNLSHGFVTYTFGQEPPVVNFTGILLNTAVDQWSELFLGLYTYFLRAPRLAELSLLHNRNYLVVIEYQGKSMYGSMLSLSKNTNAQNEQGVMFSFQFLLKYLQLAWKPSDPIVMTGSEFTRNLSNESGMSGGNNFATRYLPVTVTSNVPKSINNPNNNIAMTLVTNEIQ